jgi:hypothetical protein
VPIVTIALGLVAVVLGVAGFIAWTPWLAAVIVLGIALEGVAWRSRRRQAKVLRDGSTVAALRHIHDIRLAGYEHSARNKPNKAA